MLNLRTFLTGFAMSFLSGMFFAALMVLLYNVYFSIRDRFEERGAALHNDRLRYF
jgi:hypothetical protein